MSILRTFVKLAMPTCFVIGLILGTFLLCNSYQSWTPVYFIAAAIVVPAIFYCIFDLWSRHTTNVIATRFEKFLAKVGAFGRFVLCLYWRHIVLVTYLWTAALLAWLLVGVTAVSVLDRNKRAAAVGSSGAESERFFGILNGVTAPIQLVWGGIVLLWQTCVLLALLCFEQTSEWVCTHAVFSVSVAVVLYMLWLVVNIRQLWSEEFPDNNPTPFRGKNLLLPPHKAPSVPPLAG
jgi:hypothetical protein